LAAPGFSASLPAMKVVAALASAVAISGAAFAQTAPAAGSVVDSFELINNRAVFFEPAAGGKLKILRVVDNSRSEPIPKTPGQVAVAMTFAREIGTLIEFNSGLPYAVDYTAMVVTPGGGAEATTPLKVCPIGDELIASEQFPEPYGRIRIAGFTKRDAPLPSGC
jgi:hypothetical protein